MDYFVGVLQKYAEFSGRARRKEYWMFVLFSLVITIVLSIVDVMGGFMVTPFGSGSDTGILSGFFSLAIFIPSLAVAIRRLHDTNHSGWWWFIVLIPFIGVIVLLVFLCTDSTPGDNQYGPNPKGVSGTPASVVA